MFTLRPLTPQDEPFLWDMLYQAIYVPEGQPQPPRAIVQEPSLAHYVRGWGQQPGDLGLIGLDQAAGQPAGAAWLRLFSENDPGYGFFDANTPELSIAILPQYRGQGLGTLLIEGLFAAARGKFAAISLSVSPDNPAARLYRRLGFEEVGQSGGSLTMLKRLE